MSVNGDSLLVVDLLSLFSNRTSQYRLKLPNEKNLTFARSSGPSAASPLLHLASNMYYCSHAVTN